MTILLYNNGDTFFVSNYTYTAGKKIIAKVIASGKKGKEKGIINRNINAS